MASQIPSAPSEQEQIELYGKLVRNMTKEEFLNELKKALEEDKDIIRQGNARMRSNRASEPFGNVTATVFFPAPKK